MKVNQAVKAGLLHSCHDCSDGGLGVALAESAFAGGYGMSLNLSGILENNKLRIDKFLFSESQSRFVTTISSLNREKFEDLFAGQACYFLGKVISTPELTIKLKDEIFISASIWDLKESWQDTLR